MTKAQHKKDLLRDIAAIISKDDDLISKFVEAETVEEIAVWLEGPDRSQHPRLADMVRAGAYKLKDTP